MKHVCLIIVVMALGAVRTAATDSLAVTLRVPAKEYAYCAIDIMNNSIIAVPAVSTSSITTFAKKAIAYAPSWLSLSLEHRFAALDTALQNFLAQVILTASDPYVDEIAFTVAHMPEEALTNDGFYSTLFTENAAGIYRADSGLDYVTIVDSGSATRGGDYYSTTRYTALENGSEVTYTLPQDIYYWYIVHPKLQGELPTYISPDHPDPVAPPAGKFWRSYLWSHKEPAYGALCDTMRGISFLWANRINSPADNGALGRLSQWCNTILPWGGSPQYRRPQPVYLYNQHCGTCSEHGWFAGAAARTVLIPATLTKGARFDHKWNEFFYRRWIDWEPINGWIARIDESNHANDYWSDPSKPPLAGCFNWRGDGYIQGTTERYTPVCTLAVTVTDQTHAPVDGARITIDAPGEPGNFLLAGWTGSDGQCRFLLGDDISSFTAAVHSSRGNVAAQKVISNSDSGKRYEWSPILSKKSITLPMLSPEPSALDGGPCVNLHCSINAEKEYLSGRHEYALFGYSFPCTFTDLRSTGNIDLFICDSVNFTNYRNGKPFSPQYRINDVQKTDTLFSLPVAQKRWFLVLSADEKQNVASLVDLSLSLLDNSGARQLRRSIPAARQPVASFQVAGNSVRALYSFSERVRCRVLLYTVSGKAVCRLFDGSIGSGATRHTYPLVNIPPGVYRIGLRSAVHRSSKRIVVLGRK